MSDRRIDAYVSHARCFGADGVLEAPAGDLTESEFGERVRRLGREEDERKVVECATFGRGEAFFPASRRPAVPQRRLSTEGAPDQKG